ncbi:MAG: pseudouridine synthase [Endozoicomonadaceae bacterium]|nr:pseudouridine synthase [Endozoicomonadaceae bacterium]MBE8232621.1 pseudouridine synthase [Endozoicomonadaceae bacterium]
MPLNQENNNDVGERLQKLLARYGVASRRQIEVMMQQGQITVNSKPAALGMRVTGREKIHVNGQPVRYTTSQPDECRVLIYHKMEGELCTRHDPQQRETIFNGLPKLKTTRWITVGRLDYNTSGLLILTTDGDLAHQLMHPSSEVDREYAVRIFGTATEEQQIAMKAGVLLDGSLGHFTDIFDAGGEGCNHWYYVCIKEGKNREVRRLWDSQGLTVNRLKRVRMGNILLPRNLTKGKYRELTQLEVNALYELVKLPPKSISTALPVKHKNPIKTAKLIRKKHDQFIKKAQPEQRRQIL